MSLYGTGSVHWPCSTAATAAAVTDRSHARGHFSIGSREKQALPQQRPDRGKTPPEDRTCMKIDD